VKQIILAVTGASGAAYTRDLARQLAAAAMADMMTGGR
jgi:3-polyprenyl-4-hydroxybenzoate decarboxylase